MTLVRVRRVYEAASSEDGFRVLVDRLWPRGVRKADLSLDLWAKDAAPSTELRKAWHAAPESFDVLAKRYREELASGNGLSELVAACADVPVVTLLYGARDAAHNHAVVLRDALVEALP